MLNYFCVSHQRKKIHVQVHFAITSQFLRLRKCGIIFTRLVVKKQVC